MSNTKLKMEVAPWLSPIVKKRKNAKSNTTTPKPKATAPTVTPTVTPLLNWLHTGNDDRSIRRKRVPLFVPKKAYKSTVSGYHDDVTNPAPGDLIMATAKQMSHPAYTMKESIGAAFLLFGKVKHFTYERYPEGVKELLAVDWCYLPDDTRQYDIPPVLFSKVTLLSKRNSYDLEDVNVFLKDAVDCHWEFDRLSGWVMLV